jgi:hypothetical protein
MGWRESLGVKKSLNWNCLTEAVDTLNRAGVRLMDVPKERRRRAFELEEKIEKSASQAELERLVDEWMDCFVGLARKKNGCEAISAPLKGE